MNHLARLILAAALAPALAGCAANTVPAAWLDADSARIESIGTEYVAYVNADADLSEPEKATRRRSVEIWRADNAEHRSATNAAGGM